jgi:hypothetical protein
VSYLCKKICDDDRLESCLQNRSELGKLGGRSLKGHRTSLRESPQSYRSTLGETSGKEG